jgi:hypothetical protein
MSPDRTTAPPVADGVFVNGRVAAEVLGTYPKRLRTLAAEGRIGVRNLPGCRPVYRLRDVLTLAEQGDAIQRERMAACSS